MNKLHLLIIIFSITIFTLFISLINSRDTLLNSGPQPVIAEDDDEDEDEDEEEDEREDEREDEYEDDDDYEYIEYVTEPSESTTTLEAEPVATYINVIDNGYEIDSDKDLLVDAIDPHPLIPEINFFTDSDSDTVADAYDSFSGKDDFIYIEFQDLDGNGILDAIE